MLIRDCSWRFIDAGALSDEKSRALTQEGGEHAQHLDKISVSMDKVTKEDVLRVDPMTWWQEVCCMIFLGCVGPTGVFTVPIVTLFIGYFIVGNVTLSFQVLALLLAPLVVLPQSFNKKSLTSWLSHMILKYFSYRMVCAKGSRLYIQQDIGRITKATAAARPQIFVAPPHGVLYVNFTCIRMLVSCVTFDSRLLLFHSLSLYPYLSRCCQPSTTIITNHSPYGNILAMLIWPILTGHHFWGLTASSALRVPVFRQVLKAIGCIDAGRKHAREGLENFPYTIGISTGGVAEVFETNADDECVLLKERIGLIKLAIRTGADLVPCYLFGNTKLLSCWAGEGIPYGRRALEWISRKVLGFAAILIFGRLILPIPYRKPVLCVMGRPVPTFQIQCEEPTMEQVKEIQAQLLKGMQETFDEHKALYGWDNAHLIIK